MFNEAVAVAITSGVFGVILAVVNNRNKETVGGLSGIENGLLVPSLKYHSLFPKIKLLRTQVVLDLDMSSEGRKLIAEDVLMHKLLYTEEEYTALANEHEERLKTCARDCGRCQWVAARHAQAINSIVTRCNDYFNCREYSLEEQAILKLVWCQLNHRYAANTMYLLEAVDRTVNSKFYKDCRVQSSIIMDHANAMLGNVILDAEDTFLGINGALTGRGPFKGIIVDYEKSVAVRGA